MFAIILSPFLWLSKLHLLAYVNILTNIINFIQLIFIYFKKYEKNLQKEGILI